MKSFTHNILHLVLTTFVVALLGMYISLWQKHVELQQSYYGDSQHGGHVRAYAAACSNLCTGCDSAKQGVLSTPSLWSAYEVNHKSPTNVDATSTTSSNVEEQPFETLSPSRPTVFKTSDEVHGASLSAHDMKMHASVLTSAFSTSRMSNLKHPGIEMSHVDGNTGPNNFHVEKIGRKTNLNTMKSFHSATFEDNVRPFISMSDFLKEQDKSIPLAVSSSSGLNLETVPSTSIGDIIPSNIVQTLMQPTAVPLLQTSWSPAVQSERQALQSDSMLDDVFYQPTDPLYLSAAENRNFAHSFMSHNELTAAEYCDENDDAEDCEDTDMLDKSEKAEDVNDEDLDTLTRHSFSVANDTILQKLGRDGSSSKCKTIDNNVQFCETHNLCFKTKERDFVFLIGQKSEFKRESDTSVGGSLTFNMSAVPGHNSHTFPVVFFQAKAVTSMKVAFIEGSSTLLSRFKPDNVMHVLHDDIIPLVHTLNVRGLLHNREATDIRLIFTDLFDLKENAKLYQPLSTQPIVSLLDAQQAVDLVCLENAFTGLSMSTLWYQYGFFEPQGPLKVNETQVLLHLRKSTQYLSDLFYTPCLFCDNGNYLVLLSRKETRLIINEAALVVGLVKATKLKVLSISLETHSVKDIISIIRNSKGVIGMHGSLLIFGVFLQPGSVMIELFPYAVNPSKYTPFKTMCGLTGVVYKSWSNPDSRKSVAHPDWEPSLGGIHHLPDNTQAAILSETEVQDHLCCDDPSWLFHIYQDTYVDVDVVTNLVVLALKETTQNPEKFENDVPCSLNHKNHKTQDSSSALKETQNPENFENDVPQSFPNKKYNSQCLSSECEDDNDSTCSFSDCGENKPPSAESSKFEDLSVKVFPPKNVPYNSENIKKFLKPARVDSLTCEFVSNTHSSSSLGDHHTFKLSWDPPWNRQYLDHNIVYYDLVYVIKGEETGKTIQVAADSRSYLLSVPYSFDNNNNKVHVWIRAVLSDEVEGPYRYVECDTLLN